MGSQAAMTLMGEDANSISLVALFVAQVSAKVLCAPFERIQILRQTAPFDQKPGEAEATLSSVAQAEGAASLWRGADAMVLTEANATLVNFLGSMRGSTAVGIAIVGLSTFGVYPLEVARTRLQADRGAEGARQFPGSLPIAGVLRAAWAEGGVFALFEGLGVSVARAVAGRLVQGCIRVAMGASTFDYAVLGAMELLVGAANPRAEVMATVFLELAVQVAANYAVYPLDTLRRRLLARSDAGSPETDSLLVRSKAALVVSGGLWAPCMYAGVGYSTALSIMLPEVTTFCYELTRTAL